MSRVLPCLLAALLLGGSAPSQAAERQFRHVILADGREFDAEIKATEPQGLRMQLLQGETLISFELLIDMSPISEAEFLDQDPWIVHVIAPDDIQQDVIAMLEAMSPPEQDSMDVYELGKSGDNLPPPLAAKIRAACEPSDQKLECLSEQLRGAEPWRWLLVVERVQGGGLELHAQLSTGEGRKDEILERDSREALWDGLHEILGIEPSGSPPRLGNPSNPQPQRAKKLDERKVVALSFVPFPGVPSLAQRDAGGFALAMGVVVPSTALWVGAVGATGQSSAETGVLALGGYYAVTVLTNQVAGLRSMNRTRIGVTALPTEAGGAQLVLSARER